ncbi:MAG: hypothetical protein RIE53_02050 [Rhodothermales bacterium]
MRTSRSSLFFAALFSLAGLGCDGAELLEVTEPDVPIADTEHFFSVLADSTEYIWQNETIFRSGDLSEYSRASLITVLDSDTFGGMDGCKFFIAEMEHLGDGYVGVTGLVDYPDCPGGIDLKPDTFQVYGGDHRIEFRSASGGFTLRSMFTRDHVEAGLTGSWTRDRVETEETGQVVPSGFFDLDFRADRRFSTLGSCRNGVPTCTMNGGAFFGVSEDRFLTYHFGPGSREERLPEVDIDFMYASYYKVEGDTLSLWGTPLGHRQVFVR